jgi:hypothetical protein
LRRSFLASLALILITFGLPTNSYANEIECPNTWVVNNIDDLSKYISRTAALMNKIYGPNSYVQKTKKRSEWIFDATGQNYLIPEFYVNQDGDLDRANAGWALFMSLVAPKTQNFFIFYFSIDGCPVEGKFKVPYTVPEANVSKLPLTEWPSNTEMKDKFSSEQVFEEISTELNSLIKKIKAGYFLKGGRSLKDRFKGIKLIPFSVYDPFYYTYVTSAPHLTMLLPAEPNCIKLNLDHGLVIPRGMTCKVAVVMADQKEISARFQSPTAKLNLVLLDEFSISAKEFTMTINCRKGKITKKVSGTNPKCPKGFTKV